MPLSNSGLGNINISLPPNLASTVILEPIEGIAAGNVQAGIAELATQKLDNGSRFAAYQSAAHFINPGDFTKVLYQVETFDNFSEFENSRFIPQKAGVYLFTASIHLTIDPPKTDWRIVASLYKNGVEAARGVDLFSPSKYGVSFVVGFFPLAVGDFVEVHCYSEYSCNTLPGNAFSYFNGMQIA